MLRYIHRVSLHQFLDAQSVLQLHIQVMFKNRYSISRRSTPPSEWMMKCSVSWILLVKNSEYKLSAIGLQALSQLFISDSCDNASKQSSELREYNVDKAVQGLQHYYYIHVKKIPRLLWLSFYRLALNNVWIRMKLLPSVAAHRLDVYMSYLCYR